MNLNRTIKNLKGEEVLVAFPTRETLLSLPKDNEGNPDLTKLPYETVRDVILNCLSKYEIEDKREMFYTQTIAQQVLEADKEVDLKDNLRKFLVKVLEKSAIRKENDKTSGVYYGWVIAQVLEELGETVDN